MESSRLKDYLPFQLKIDSVSHFFSSKWLNTLYSLALIE